MVNLGNINKRFNCATNSKYIFNIKYLVIEGSLSFDFLGDFATLH